MQKSEKLILKSFMEFRVPEDFNKGVSMTLMVSTISGLVSRSIKGEIIEYEEISKYLLSKEEKKEISAFLKNDISNLIYYNLIKTCYLIILKYSIKQ
ncbi:MAG: hypothetical protein FWE36_00210 [Erysipelotrichales bacterium]|nr:hypothetical protein [Erysipelotrichales bacterium]